MDKITIIGTYEIGGVRCEAKYDDHGDYIIMYSTEEGKDIPISGSQVKISKDLVSTRV